MELVTKHVSISTERVLQESSKSCNALEGFQEIQITLQYLLVIAARTISSRIKRCKSTINWLKLEMTKQWRPKNIFRTQVTQENYNRRSKLFSVFLRDLRFRVLWKGFRKTKSQSSGRHLEEINAHLRLWRIL